MFLRDPRGSPTSQGDVSTDIVKSLLRPDNQYATSSTSALVSSHRVEIAWRTLTL